MAGVTGDLESLPWRLQDFKTPRLQLYRHLLLSPFVKRGDNHLFKMVDEKLTRVDTTRVPGSVLKHSKKVQYHLKNATIGLKERRRTRKLWLLAPVSWGLAIVNWGIRIQWTRMGGPEWGYLSRFEPFSFLPN